MTDCPDCGDEANITVDEGENILECLERDCLHWEVVA